MVCGLTANCSTSSSVLTYPCFYQFDNGVMTLCLFHEISPELCSFSRMERVGKRHCQPDGQPGDVCTIGDRHTKQIKPSGN